MIHFSSQLTRAYFLWGCGFFPKTFFHLLQKITIRNTNNSNFLKSEKERGRRETREDRGSFIYSQRDTWVSRASILRAHAKIYEVLSMSLQYSISSCSIETTMRQPLQYSSDANFKSEDIFLLGSFSLSLITCEAFRFAHDTYTLVFVDWGVPCPPRAVEGCASKPHPRISVGHASPLLWNANDSAQKYVTILTRRLLILLLSSWEFWEWRKGSNARQSVKAKAKANYEYLEEWNWNSFTANLPFCWRLGLEMVRACALFLLAFVGFAHSASAHNCSHLRPCQARFISISGLC